MWRVGRRLIGLGRRGVASHPPGNHVLPELPYSYNALAPIISEEIMLLHHLKHHKVYVENLNKVEGELKSAIAQNDLIKSSKLCHKYRMYAGAHVNHSLFWKNLCPCSALPSGQFEASINEQFGSLCDLKINLINVTSKVIGSGWVWLAMDPQSKQISVQMTPLELSLKQTTGKEPLLGIDLWEHAYYPQYVNRRSDYVRALFEIFNWKEVGKRFDSVYYCNSNSIDFRSKA